MENPKIAVEVDASITNLQTQFTAATKSALDFGTKTKSALAGVDAAFNNTNKNIFVGGNKYIHVNEQMAERTAALAKAQRLAATAATSQAAATSVSTSILGGFGNAVTKSVSALRGLAYIIPGLGIAGVFGLAYEAIVAVASQLDMFKSKMAEAKLASDVLGKSFESTDYQNAVKNVSELSTNIDLARRGLISKESVVQQYNETIGKTTGLVSSLDEAEQQLTKNAPAYIKMMLLRAQASEALAQASKKSVEAEQNLANKELSFWDKAKDVSLAIVGGIVQSDQTGIFANTKTKRIAEAAQLKKDSDILLAIFKKTQDEAAKLAKDNGFNLFGDNKENKSDESLKELKKQLKEAKEQFQLTILEASGPLSDTFLSGLKGHAAEKVKKALEGITADIKPPEIKADGWMPFGELYTEGQIFGDYVSFDLLPKLGSGFESFFNDILEKGKFSFEALGASIMKTFASVLASEATQGLLGMFGAKDSKGDKLGKGGLLSGIGSLLGLGGKAAGIGGGGAAVAGGTAATGGLLLPILGGLMAGGLIASLFKKKDRTPDPVPMANGISQAYSNTISSGGEVIFKIAGTTLVGVLSNTGYSLSRIQNRRG